MKKHHNIREEMMPRRLDDLVGCDTAKSLAKMWLREERFPKAILVSGEMGAGKSLLAKLLTDAAGCAGRPVGSTEPCGTCDVCRKAAYWSGMTSTTGSEVNEERFEMLLNMASSGGAGMLCSDPTPRWVPLVVDEMHELRITHQRILRAALDVTWERGFLIGTTTNPERLDSAVRDRMYEIEMIPPSRSVLVEWIAGICRRYDIPVEDRNGIALLVERCEGRFRSILRALQSFHDLDTPITADAVRRMFPVAA